MRTVRATGGMFMLEVLVVWLLGSSAAVGAEKPLRPEVTGLSVCKPDPQDEYGGSAVRGHASGVEVHLRLAAPDDVLVKMREDPQRPFTVTDSQGNLLSTDEDNSSLGVFARIASDGHGCQWSVKAARMPAADTMHLRLQGTLLLTCGAEPKEVTGVVPAKKGQQFQIGQIPVTLADVGKPRFLGVFAPLAEDAQAFAPEQEDFKWRVRLETKNADGFISVRDIEFFTPDGQPIKTRWSSSGNSNFGLGVFATPLSPDTPATDLVPDLTHYTEYEFATEVPEFQYRATCFQELKTKTVSVDIEVGLGL